MPKEPTVWIVQVDQSRDFNDARKYGLLQGIFTKSRNRSPTDYVAMAHAALRDYKDGDYILLVGDPMLCGIVMAVALEKSQDGVLDVLRWDKLRFNYKAEQIDFGLVDPEEDKFNPEEHL